MLNIFYQNDEYPIRWKQAKNLLEAVRNDGRIPLSAPCGGAGTCGKCRVRVLAGEAPVTPEDEAFFSLRELEDGYRLACRMPVTPGLSIEIPDGGERKVLGLEGQTVSDGEHRGPYHLLTDTGTTTLAFLLLDADYRIIRQMTRENRQTAYGADVISRMKEAMESPEAQKGLVESLHRQFASLSSDLLGSIPPEKVVSWTVAGNTVMMHFLYGLNTEGMTRAPFEPSSLTAPKLTARQIGLEGGGTLRIEHLPCISSYVGADITAGILATGMADSEEPVLLVDIGTNGEMALGNRNGIRACSTAAGPAFEGGHLSSGCGGVPGAIDHFTGKERIEYTTLGDCSPIGICGSGILDLLAIFLDWGLVDETGSMQEVSEGFLAERGLRRIEVEYNPKIVLDGVEGDLGLSQKDIREIQLAKAAVAAGIRILIGEAGLNYASLDRLILAGGFGTYLDPRSAGKIGLIPSELQERVIARGNTSLLGLHTALEKEIQPGEILDLTHRVEVIDLNGHPDFQNFYVESMLF